ncbi:hypothetical protein LC605_07190 [Nostoc sp. CHAB 5836]|jgi:hypothetical protein|uniref:hypothetical protein n=1 Tax=Nostoc sp. CHAB 5836 TaxID=2780404 RepID=UPI001E3596F0|nr:hypothetical protein [Nostoc sp. CHAB 5836]MCC5614859.1 hypothetical protein [Nostoc sp. CHAB 5836]
MQVLENNTLFTEVSAEQSSVVSGGKKGKKGNDFHFNLDAYLFVIGAGMVYGVPGLSADETYYAWESAISL